MRWLMDRLAPPPEFPPPADDDAARLLGERMGSLRGHSTDLEIVAAREELGRWRARLAALDVRAAVRARQATRE